MKTFAFIFVACASVVAAVAQTQPPPPNPEGVHAPPPAAQQLQLPDKFTNLKILPKDISKDDLVKTMKAFSLGLGVRCDHCHVLTNEKKDFAADTKSEKQMAREMMKLVHKLNTEFFTYKDAPKATCYLCHHGEHKPALAPVAAGQAPPHDHDHDHHLP